MCSPMGLQPYTWKHALEILQVSNKRKWRMLYFAFGVVLRKVARWWVLKVFECTYIAELKRPKETPSPLFEFENGVASLES